MHAHERTGREVEDTNKIRIDGEIQPVTPGAVARFEMLFTELLAMVHVDFPLRAYVSEREAELVEAAFAGTVAGTELSETEQEGEGLESHGPRKPLWAGFPSSGSSPGSPT
jgi:hypothetical protein